MYQQRVEPDDTEIIGLWQPTRGEDAPDLAPRADDWYAVVDDIETGRVVLVASPWPGVDDTGHLVFDEEEWLLDLPVGRLQEAVDRERRASGQPAPTRALRIGDAFHIRSPHGLDGTDPSPEQWRMVDVTRAARRSARAAQLVAANPALRTSGTEAADGPASEPSPGEGDDRPPGRPTAGASAPVI